MQYAASAESERAERMQSLLRLNLTIRDGSANVYWKHDGARFSSKPKDDTKANDWRGLCSGSTLKMYSGRTYRLTLSSNRPVKIRPNSGRWDVKEIDAEGLEVLPQLQLQPSSHLPQPMYRQPPPPLPTPPSQLPTAPQPQSLNLNLIDMGAEVAASPAATPPGDSGDVSTDPQAISWVEATADAARSTFTATLPCTLPPTAAGRRQYLLIDAYVEEFGLVVCPIQIKVYKVPDRNALSSFPLRFVQFDFREDSSFVGGLLAVNFYRY
ncbi:hypothetical protein VaNZ11_013520 [Volvox africanus]|uniref:Uncharacterized protein n=1 Tax=Volvox africanus TaxID=51714 RepID=A0ABQ5SGT7_9CHLO|nr:hypothetical protein VaNZ11_013520 [Volvox africanus]